MPLTGSWLFPGCGKEVRGWLVHIANPATTQLGDEGPARTRSHSSSWEHGPGKGLEDTGRTGLCVNHGWRLRCRSVGVELAGAQLPACVSDASLPHLPSSPRPGRESASLTMSSRSKPPTPGRRRPPSGVSWKPEAVGAPGASSRRELLFSSSSYSTGPRRENVFFLKAALNESSP